MVVVDWMTHDSEAWDGHGRTWVGRRKRKTPLSKLRKGDGGCNGNGYTERERGKL